MSENREDIRYIVFWLFMYYVHCESLVIKKLDPFSFERNFG